MITFRFCKCIFLLITITFFSCKKDITKDELPNIYINQVSEWIESKIIAASDSRENILLLKKNIDYSKIHEETYINNEKILIIPIKEEYKTVRHLNKNINSNLIIIIDNKDRIRTGNIVFYTSKSGQDVELLPENTFYNIRYNATNVTDGNYVFCGLSGKRQYELSYQDGVLVREAKVKSGKSTKTNNTEMVISTSMSDCYDMYLITTYYDNNGNNLGSDRQYLGRFGNCGGLGEVQVPQQDPDAGGNEIPQENIYAKQRSKTWLVMNVTETFAIYKTNTFTTLDGFILKIGFGGLGTSNKPSNSIVEQIAAGANIANSRETATTHCSASVTYDTSPFDPQTYSGSQNWTASQVSN